MILPTADKFILSSSLSPPSSEGIVFLSPHFHIPLNLYLQ